MFRNQFITIQDHTPNPKIIPEFGGVIYRLKHPIADGLTDNQLRHTILTGYRLRDSFYTIPINMEMIMDQAKSNGQYFMVNNNIQRYANVSYETYGRVSGIIADILLEQGYTTDSAAILLMNEPHKFIDKAQYVQYAQYANKYVKGRLPLILINDEWGTFDAKYIFDGTANIENRILGPHLLSSFTGTKEKVEDAKKFADAYGVGVICTEGGSWYQAYTTHEGNHLNKTLIKMTYEAGFEGCAIVCVDMPIAPYNGRLGYRIWKADFSDLIRDSEGNPVYPLNFFNDFINYIKLFKKKEGTGDMILETLYDQEYEEINGIKYGPYRTKGYLVEWAQMVMADLEDLHGEQIYKGEIDGKYGPATKAATKKLQETLHLKGYPNIVVDGKFGRKMYGWAVEELIDAHNQEGHRMDRLLTKWASLVRR